MLIDEFLEKFVDGYLLSDLETMSHDNAAADKTCGAVGYPMMTTVLAGMELLGGLLMTLDQTFDPDGGGSGKLINFWDNYFCNQYPAYKGLGSLFYALIRNGVAHTFVAKHGIVIQKFSNQGIKVDLLKKEVHVDCNVFYKEFETTYKQKVLTIKDKSLMQKRLDQIDKAYAKKSTYYFDRITTLNPDVINMEFRAVQLLGKQPRASGASYAMGPTGEIPLISTTTTNTTTSFTTTSGTLFQDDNKNL